MNLTERSNLIYTQNKEKGFYKDYEELLMYVRGTKLEESFHQFFYAQRLALIQSEVSEALEAIRSGKKANLKEFEQSYEFHQQQDMIFPMLTFERTIKDTEPDEIADSIIRLLDYSGFRGIDIEKHVKFKLEYNSKRAQLHGKSF